MTQPAVAPGASTTPNPAVVAGAAAMNGAANTQVDPGTTPPTKVDPPEVDESKWDEGTKKYIAKLRSENADRRTKVKTTEEKLSATSEQLAAIKKTLGIEDEATPEQKIEVLQAEAHAAQHAAQIYKIALDKGIPGGDVEYFSFLVNKAAQELGENEEMSAEALDGIVAEVKKRSTQAPAMTSTSVVTPGTAAGTSAPGSENPTAISAGDFAKMTITQKSDLFVKNRALYDRLFKEAREKRLLV